MPSIRPAGSPKWKQAIASGVLSGIAKHVTTVYLIPVGVPVLVGGLAYLEAQSWSYILTCMVLSSAGISTTLVMFGNWREKHRVEGKLTFAGLLVGQSPSGGVNLGLVINNRSGVPIAFEFLEARSRLKNSVPAGPPAQFKGELGVHNKAQFYLGAIHIGSVPKPGEQVEGSIEAKIRYGRVGATPKYNLELRKGVIVTFGQASKIIGHVPYEMS